MKYKPEPYSPEWVKAEVEKLGQTPLPGDTYAWEHWHSGRDQLDTDLELEFWRDVGRNLLTDSQLDATMPKFQRTPREVLADPVFGRLDDGSPTPATLARADGKLACLVYVRPSDGAQCFRFGPGDGEVVWLTGDERATRVGVGLVGTLLWRTESEGFIVGPGRWIFRPGLPDPIASGLEPLPDWIDVPPAEAEGFSLERAREKCGPLTVGEPGPGHEES